MNHALVVAGFLGATGVAAGAFGAHALEALVTPAQLDIWSTAAQYHLIHAVVVTLASAALPSVTGRPPPRRRRFPTADCSPTGILAPVTPDRS